MNTPVVLPPKRSLWPTVLRLGVALVLFGVVLWLVPWRDQIHWPSRFGDEAVQGHITWPPGGQECQFESDDGVTLVLRTSAEASGWTHLVEEGVERPLTDAERTELEGEPEQGLLTTLRGMNPWWLALAVGLYVVGACLSFLRWHMLLHAVGVKAGLGRCFKLGFLGLFFSNIIPGMTGGDLVKAIYVARDHRGQRPEAVLSVLVDRAIGLLGLALLAAFALLFNLDRFRDLALGLYGLLAVILIGCCVVFSRRLRGALHLDRLMARLPAAEVLRKLDRAVLLYREAPGKVVLSIVMSLGVHAMVLLAIAVIGRALELPIAFADYYALAPLPLIIQAVPIAPAGIGVGEAAFVWVLSSEAALVTVQQALALALSYRAVQFAVSLLGGVMLLMGSEKHVTAAEMNHPAGPAAPEGTSGEAGLAAR